MWTRTLPLVLVCVCLQVPPCPASCPLYGLTAACSFKNLHWVPALPSNITALYLEFNHISEINSTSLRALRRLQDIDLGNQSVPLVIRNNAFLRQTRLLRLVLGLNLGLRLEPRAFSGLFNLQHLFLDHCGLTESFLAGTFLQPLLSLETLDLFGNKITRLQPGLFFLKLRRFRELNLKLNAIGQLCEEDLVGFRGKDFTLLNLRSTRLSAMSAEDFDWEKCGNPFRGMTFKQLDLSSNGLTVQGSEKFFKAIEGTLIEHLLFSGHIGKGFSFEQLPDPDSSTFEGLRNSQINQFDLSKNYIFALHPEVFSAFRDVTIIDVSMNKINQIKRDAFRGIQGHVRMLNLSSNLLGEVRYHMFVNLTELRVLDLSQNHIGALGYEAFGGLPRLRALYLTGNSLRQLGSPGSLPDLEYLLLGNNKLTSLYRVEVLAANSVHVDVSDNKLTNLRDVYDILARFKRLQILFYGGNLIKWCNPDPKVTVPINNSLLALDLHDSSLQIVWAQGKCLDLFGHMENLLGLNISFNSLAALPQGIFSGLSSLWELDLSFNALTYLETDVFPSSLKRLDLSNNFLASLDPAPFRDLFFINLARNRFHCDCSLWSFLAWLSVTNVTFLGDGMDYRCEFPTAQHNRHLLDFSSVVEPCDKDDEQSVQELRLALFVLSAVLVGSAALGGLVYAHLRGRIFILYKKVVGRVLEGPKPPPPEERARYDAYLCFSNQDYEWVEEALLGRLDQHFSEQNLLRCCFEARDFLPGEDHLSNIRDAVWSSRKTLCVVSKEFLKDGWCLEAFTLAQGRMLEELTDVLIVLVVGKMQHYQLMRHNTVRAFVQRREYLSWPEDPQDLDWFYERLLSKILTQTEVRMAAQDRAERDRAERDRAEQDRAERGRAEQDRAEQDRAERDRAAQDRAVQGRAGQDRAERDQDCILMQEIRAVPTPGPRDEQLQAVREEQLQVVREVKLHNVREEQLHDVREEQLEYAREEQLQEEQVQDDREEQLHDAREEQLHDAREEQLKEEQL